MTAFKALREIPKTPGYKRGDVMVIFGELFSRGYANGIVAEAEKAGLTIVRSTVGRRDAEGKLRALNDEELSAWPKPYINIPLEAGFDFEPAADGTTPTDQLKGVKINEWDQVRMDWDKVNDSRARGVARFKKNVTDYMKQLEALVPKGANILFVHTMAGGVPRAKILMPTINRVFKGTGDRYVESERFVNSDMGKFSLMNFTEVTANTFQILLDLSTPLRERVERDGGKAHYVAYGYHGTEVLVRNEYRWQTYTHYFQGWAKMDLEQVAEKAWEKGIKAQVFNCPEILTNSSSVFQGVEVSLYPFLAALKKEGATSTRAKTVLTQAQSLMKPEHTLEEMTKFTDDYITSPVIRACSEFDRWPQHTSREQMEKMLSSSDHLISMHKDEKQLITFLLSDEVFNATGVVMFNESWNPTAPVLWLGHDVLAKTIAR